MNRNSSPGQQSRSPDGKPIRAQKSISDFLAADPAKRNRSKSPADQAPQSKAALRREETLKKFRTGYKEQATEEQSEGTSRGLFTAQANFVDQDGQTVINPKSELQKSIKKTQTEIDREFQNKLKDARPADYDLFGVKRRVCEICASECSGYEPTKVLFGGKGEFPTFCKHCNCPAHFHKLEEEVQNISESLSDLLTGRNIQSEDLNYNCVFAAFMIKDIDERNQIQTSIDIARLIKDEGIEILTSSKRFLSFHEAFYLRNRVVATSERKLAKTLAQDFQKRTFESDIKKKGEIDSLNMNQLAQNNEFFLERLSQIKEYHMKKIRDTFGTSVKEQIQNDAAYAQEQSRKKSHSLGSRPADENRSDLSNSDFDRDQQQFDLGASINQRDTNFQSGNRKQRINVANLDSLELGPIQEESKAKQDGNLKSLLKRSNGNTRSTSMPLDKSSSIRGMNFDMHNVFQEIHRREEIMPPKHSQNFKIKFGTKTKNQHKKKFVEEVKEYDKAAFLLHALETNPLLRELCENEIMLLVLNSANNTNLVAKLNGILKQSSVGSQEAMLLYTSDNKIKAMEDCIEFSPELFRVQKSIVVSEPVIPFPLLLRMQTDSQGRYNNGVPEDALDHEFLSRQDSIRSKNTMRSNMKHSATQGRPHSKHKSKAQTQIDISNQLKQRGGKTFGFTNPFRNKTTVKKTHYMDQKSMTLQRKLSVIDKVSFGRTKTGKLMKQASSIRPTSPRGGSNMIRKQVTFKTDQQVAFNTQSSAISSQRDDLRSVMMKNQQESNEDPHDISQADWVLEIKEKQKEKTKDTKMTDEKTLMVQYNYGVMQDFFAYSATCVQKARTDINMSLPICPAGIRGGQPLLNFRHLQTTLNVNMFAVAKVGVANMILPNTLDVKLTNYEDHDSYISISDHFFPDNARSQHTIVVLRPSIVKNGLNELMLQIIKANEFLILKRQIRMLTKAEVAYLYSAEKIQKRNQKLYYNMMTQGPSEIIVVSKLSAVFDCNTLFNGANPFGRRRINYLNEAAGGQRKNVDSVDAMFEIAPFTCFSEFIDVEDFLLRNSKIDKFRKMGEDQNDYDEKKFAKTAELLYATKLVEIRKEVNLLQRNFNLVGYTPKSVETASQELCIFSPTLGNIQEVCLILNPIYNKQVDAAFEVLIRADFKILQYEKRQLSEMQANDLIGSKYGGEDGAELVNIAERNVVHCFHLAKLAGDREIRELYRQSDLQFEDLLYATNWGNQFKPIQIPYLFYFMDTERTYELCLRLLYNKQQIQYTGEDFESNMENLEVASIIQQCLLVTVGDKLKRLMIDHEGNVQQQSKVEANSIDNFEPLNAPEDLQDKDKGVMDGYHIEPQFMQKLSNAGQKSCSVHYIAEADKHGLFEIRFHRLAHLGDRENSDTFPNKQIEVDMAIENDNYKQVIAKEAMILFQRFASCSYYYNEVNKMSYNVCPAFYKFKIQPFQWIFEQLENGHNNDDDYDSSLVTDIFFDDQTTQQTDLDHEQKVHSEKTMYTGMTGRQNSLHKLGTIYGEDAAKKSVTQKNRQAKFEKEWKEIKTCRRLMRVYEVEEHMGNEFMEELSRLHQEHLNIVRHNFLNRMAAGDSQESYDKRKSLPAYIYGVKLAEMVKQLETIKCFGRGQLRGAGKIVYNRQTQVLQGELPRVTQNSYYDYDRKRYLGMLDNFKKGWLYYLSVLETEIIESKLMFILDSLTFRYTRQPQFLIVAPDRLTSMNLRISEKIKILNENPQDPSTKFFKPLSEDLIDPNRELDIRNHVDSVLQTLNHSMLKADVDKKLKEQGTSMQEVLDSQPKSEQKHKPYSIHKDCAVAGVDAIARRPKYHLIASVLWLLDFTMRKVSRKSEFFVGDRNRKDEAVQAKVEEEYDEVLDILKTAISAKYGNDEINAALDIVDLKQGGFETEFERHMRKKQNSEQKVKDMKQKIDEEKRRAARQQMTINELIVEEVQKPADEFQKQQRKELAKFLDLRGGLDRDGTEFMQMLENSKMHFGPYALQLADEFFNKQMKNIESKIDPSKQDEQEKISYVKMEYFLYGVAEADRVIEQLKSMEVRMDTLAKEADSKYRDAEELKPSGMASGYNNRHQNLHVGGNYQEDKLKQARIKKSYEKKLADANKAEESLKEQRFEISSKETQLLLIFRELMSFDFYVADHYFERDFLELKREKKIAQERYIVPLQTFWKPIEFNEYFEYEKFGKTYGISQPISGHYETDLTDRKYFKQIHPIENVEHTIGQYLSKPLRDNILRNNQDQIEKLRYGGEETSLRHHEPVKRTDKIVFDKFMSHGQKRQDETMLAEKRILDFKTGKKAYQAYNPFNFEDTPQ